MFRFSERHAGRSLLSSLIRETFENEKNEKFFGIFVIFFAFSGLTADCYEVAA